LWLIKLENTNDKSSIYSPSYIVVLKYVVPMAEYASAVRVVIVSTAWRHMAVTVTTLRFVQNQAVGHITVM
jgi:hypothetical protein